MEAKISSLRSSIFFLQARSNVMIVSRLLCRDKKRKKSRREKTRERKEKSKVCPFEDGALFSAFLRDTSVHCEKNGRKEEECEGV